MGNVKIIAASAGSGKTYRLAYEYVRTVVGDPSLYRHILAVTFTNKATEEMSSRILERLHQLATPDAPSPYLADLMGDLHLDEHTVRERAAEARRLILHDYSRFAVLTIDRFFQRLIRAFMRELGVDGGFSLELETDSLLELAADALIDRAASDEGIRERVFAATAGRLEDGKRWDIREGLVALGGELFGEEYQRISDAATASDAPAIVPLIEAVVEKAAKAQAEMKAKALETLAAIESAGLDAADFKGGRTRSLVPWLAKVAAGGFLPLSSAARNALESDDESGWVARSSPAKSAVEALIPTLQPMLAELDGIYSANSRLVASAALIRENRHNFVLLADLQRQVERICLDENIVPISETNRMIARLVGGNDTPFIFERAGNYFSRFLIDEFQDTSALQWENFVPLLRDAIASAGGEPVMLIGDVKQAIYRWRGSDWRILSHRVREEMGAGRVAVETLDTNYRSLRRVVEFNNMAIGRMVEADSASLDATIADARAAGSLTSAEAAELTGMLSDAYTGHTQRPRSEADEGYVTFTVYGPDAGGNYLPPIVERIEELQSRGYRAGDIAVLVRSNNQGGRVAQMLLERKRANPASPYRYDVVTQEALTVGASAASRFIIACLSLASPSSSDHSIQRAVLNRWLGRDFDAPLTGDETAFFARIAAMSPEQAFEEVVLRFGLQSRTADIAYIQAIHGQIIAFSSRSVADLPLFLKWWNERGAAASITMGQDADAITVSTIHKSKGLQYKVVIVPYLSWSMGPETRGRQMVVWAEAKGEDELDELGAMPLNYKKLMAESHFAPDYYREQVLAHIDALNLFYVAVTRAEDELHLMSSLNTRLGKDTVGNMLCSVLGVKTGKGAMSGEVLEFGQPTHPVTREDSGSTALTTYHTARPDAKVKLKIASGERDHGVEMHKAFERATSADDIQKALERMPNNSLVREWFDTDWDEIHSEAGIILPGTASTKRPDRVMIKGKRAVVVDYKFGAVKRAEYVSQMRTYMTLLSEMGYEPEGHIWYVALDKIEKV